MNQIRWLQSPYTNDVHFTLHESLGALVREEGGHAMPAIFSIRPFDCHAATCSQKHCHLDSAFFFLGGGKAGVLGD